VIVVLNIKASISGLDLLLICPSMPRIALHERVRGSVARLISSRIKKSSNCSISPVDWSNPKIINRMSCQRDRCLG